MNKEEKIALKLTELWLSTQTKDLSEYSVLNGYNYFLNNLQKSIDKIK